MKKIAGLLLFFGMALAATGCGSGAKTVGPYQLQLAIYTPLCMEVEGANLAEGGIVQSYPCIDGERRQEWMLKPVDGSLSFNIMNVNSSQCMSVSEANPNPSTPIVQAPCYSPAIPSQMWAYTPAPAPRMGYLLVSALNNLCLDIPEGETVGETQLQVYTCTVGDPAQGFVLRSVPEGQTP